MESAPKRSRSKTTGQGMGFPLHKLMSFVALSPSCPFNFPAPGRLSLQRTSGNIHISGINLHQSSQRGPTIAIAKLEVGGGVQEGVAELVLQLPEAVIPGRDALIARQEVVLDLLIAVDVTQEVHPIASP